MASSDSGVGCGLWSAALKPLINGAIVDMVTTGVTEEKLTALAGKLREAGSEEYRSIYQQIYDRWQAEN